MISNLKDYIKTNMEVVLVRTFGVTSNRNQGYRETPRSRIHEASGVADTHNWITLRNDFIFSEEELSLLLSPHVEQEMGTNSLQVSKYQPLQLLACALTPSSSHTRYHLGFPHLTPNV